MESFNLIGAIVINFLRPNETILCLQTLQQYAPDIRIYVGDQDIENSFLKTYCQENRINYISLPYDCGIGISRNTLIDYAKKDNCQYILWGDNDFVYDSRFRLQNALKILEKDKQVGIVGGTVLKNNIVQHYERLIYYSKFYQTACFIPLEYTFPEAKFADNVDYYYCDMTFNFCLARITIFDKNVRWDDEIKVKFEHSFFFCKFLKHNNLRVAYCPSMMVNHEHKGSDEYQAFRNRTTDGYLYSQKLKIKAGFGINETSWNHIDQKPFDFKNIPLNSKPYESAFKYSQTNLENIEKLEKNDINLNFLNVEDLALFLKTKGIVFILVKDTCKYVIQTKTFDNSSKLLHIGTPSKLAFKYVINSFGFMETQENKFSYKDLMIEWSEYQGNTKGFSVNNEVFLVPFPVTSYLQAIYGKNWNKELDKK